MLTPFPKADAAKEFRKRVYNKKHSRTRIVVKCAFGREDVVDIERPLSNLQGLAKRDDLANVFFDNE
ncbi:hypothetical protein PHMEG_0005887 [Phytophthora megakarya]|uniref:Uncharacterized protein n=1 Tax=Phytophthora megakarya TaxID=4795 RepID=A0A225WQA1_9STRA|nr:hypothetical protein PHMEG_0005887 [Phytophthora megakarya]